MPRAKRLCPNNHLVDHGKPCMECRRESDRKRGTFRERGYTKARHDKGFREGVLTNDPYCTCTDTSHGHGPRCTAWSTVADHHPRDRRELEALGLDADDPQYGRGLCASCHNKHTAVSSPGGWNAR